MSNVDEYTDFSQADKELCRKARQPSSDDAYSAAFIPADLLAVLKSGYQMHDSWRSKAADTIERLQKECLRQKLDLQEVKTANMELAQLQPSHLKQERDAALAEVERLKARLSESQDEAEAMRTTITSGEWGMI